MIALSLARELIVLLLMMACGYTLVKTGLADAKDSRILSVVCVYLVVPCALLKAFQLEYSDDIRNGFFLALAIAFAVHILFFIIVRIFTKIWHLDVTERMSVIYTNGGTLVMAIVLAVFGEEWVIYTSAYSLVQTVFIWTHGQSVMRGIRSYDLKKILANVNLVAVAAGFILFITGIRMPALPGAAVSGMAAMFGPANMLMIGMVIGGTSWKEILGEKRAYLTVFLRLVAVPCIVLLLLKAFRVAELVPDGNTIVLISFLSIAAPAALTVTQLAQIYRGDVVKASAINVLTTILSVITMPLWCVVYYML